MGPGAAGASARPAAWGDDSSDDELPLGTRLKAGASLVLSTPLGRPVADTFGHELTSGDVVAQRLRRRRRQRPRPRPRSPLAFPSVSLECCLHNGLLTTLATAQGKAEKRPASVESAGKGALKQEEKPKAKRAKKEPGEPAVKRERKVYDMPGQTKATPDEVTLPEALGCCGLCCCLCCLGRRLGVVRRAVGPPAEVLHLHAGAAAQQRDGQALVCGSCSYCRPIHSKQTTFE